MPQTKKKSGTKDTDAALVFHESVPSNYDENTIGVLLTHGAGGNYEQDRFVKLSQNLCDLGYLVIRMNFAYRNKGPKQPPARMPALMKDIQQGHALLSQSGKYPCKAVVLAGQSMGGRACQMYSIGVNDESKNEFDAETPRGAAPLLCTVLLNYPLKPPGAKELRRQPLLDSILPVVLLTGSRDSMMDHSAIRTIFEEINVSKKLIVVPAASHCMECTKASGLDNTQVLKMVAHDINCFVKEQDAQEKGYTDWDSIYNKSVEMVNTAKKRVKEEQHSKRAKARK